MSIQEALRQMRLEMGLTQTDLAQKLNKSFLTVNRWENGKGFPNRDNAKNILKIARVGGVSKDCYSYLDEVLKPDVKRGKSAAVYGFPDIDRDFLFQLADGSTNSLYVIEAGTYNLLYLNKKAERRAALYLEERGESAQERSFAEQTDKRCFYYFGGRSEPCPFCPINTLSHDEYTDSTVTIPETGRILHVHAKIAKMKEREVYIIYLTDLTEKNAETHALYELTNDIPGGVGIYNVYNDNRIELEFMNETLFKMIGAGRTEALLQSGRTDLCLVHPADRKRLWKEIRSALAQNKNLNIKLRMRVLDGKYHLLLLNGRLIKKDTKKNTFYCLFTDTEDK